VSPSASGLSAGPSPAVGSAPDRGEGWVQPYWLERQLDPRSPDVVVAPSAAQLNCTHRSWTVLGTLASPERAAVDERGFVCAGSGQWGVDWWIGAGDRWRHPSREPGVRQQLLGGSPVVETTLRVPGGAIVHRACGVRSAGGAGDAPHVLIEIENRCTVAVVVAVAIRPTGLTGPGSVASIDVDGPEVRVDGHRALVLSKPPAQVALATAADGDVAAAVAAEQAVTGAQGACRCAEGRAQAALLLPLPHTAVLRMSVPIGTTLPASTSAWRRRASAAPVATPVATLPESARVVSGWDLQAGRGLRVSLPAGRLADVVEATRRSLLLTVSSEDLSSWPDRSFAFHDAALVLDAAGRWGFTDEVSSELATWGERQTLDGWFADSAARSDATGAALWAAGTHWRLTHDGEVVDALLGPLAKGVHAIERRCTRRRREAGGLVPRGASPRWVGDAPGPVLHDTFWSWAGALAAADAMDGIGQADVAAGARGLAAALAGDLRATLDRDGSEVLPPRPGRRIDGGVVANLVACDPLGVLPPDDPRMAATLEAVRARFTVDAAVVEAIGPAGFNPVLTAWLAGAEILAGDDRALGRLAWLAQAASSTCAWPEVIHPRSGGGSVGEGHHAPAGAAFLRAIRQMLVRETAEGLALCSLLPEGWEGQGIEVHDAPTAVGLVSYAVRWHGDRPAILWELQPHADVDPDAVVLASPGLDPGWRARGTRGDALLAPFARAAATPAEPAERAAPAEPAEPAERVAPAAGTPVEGSGPFPGADGGSFS
jgi:hypothetical protein